MKKIKLLFMLFGFIIGIVITTSLFLFTTEKKELDPYILCSEFYELNKNNNFEGLFNVQILSIREYSEYDKYSYQIQRIPLYIGINDSISKDNIKLPSFKNGADLKEKERFFNRCRSKDINYLKTKYKIDSDKDLFNCYVEEIESIYAKYYKIKTPCMCPSTNITLNGCNEYIEFILYKNEEEKINYRCYYVKDTIFSNDRLVNYFERLPKFDEHWYYDVN